MPKNMGKELYLLDRIISGFSFIQYVTTVLFALIRGTYYILYYRITRKNVRIGFPFKAFAKVIIKGPGKVIIEKHCVAAENVFTGLTIVTFNPKSFLRIGQRSVIGGTTICCRNKIIIENDVMSANSLIQDTLFLDNKFSKLDLLKDTMDDQIPIVVGKNAWIGGNCIILEGTTVGKDCVIGAGSVAWQTTLPDYSLGNGNLIKRGMSIIRILSLMGAN